VNGTEVNGWRSERSERSHGVTGVDGADEWTGDREERVNGKDGGTDERMNE
jgi:hypothetical protein